MHGELGWVRQRQPVIHKTEDTLLVLATVVGSKDTCLSFLDVETSERFGVGVVTLPIFVGNCTGVDDDEVRLEVIKFGRIDGANKHVGTETEDM